MAHELLSRISYLILSISVFVKLYLAYLLGLHISGFSDVVAVIIFLTLIFGPEIILFNMVRTHIDHISLLIFDVALTLSVVPYCTYRIYNSVHFDH